MIIYRHYYILCFISLTTLLIGCLHASKQKLKVGSQAPDFTLYDERGVAHTLSALREHKVALIFYPLNQTSGCTKELCSLRDGFADLQSTGIMVLGVNPGSPESHKAFKAEHHFPFPLLSDKGKKVAKAYGAKRPLGLPIRRITVLIDEQGIVVAIMHDINVADHAQEIIHTFQTA
jgi:peroxiredoxin Q/BCP